MIIKPANNVISITIRGSYPWKSVPFAGANVSTLLFWDLEDTHWTICRFSPIRLAFLLVSFYLAKSFAQALCAIDDIRLYFCAYLCQTACQNYRVSALTFFRLRYIIAYKSINDPLEWLNPGRWNYGTWKIRQRVEYPVQNCAGVWNVRSTFLTKTFGWHLTLLYNLRYSALLTVTSWSEDARIIKWLDLT